MKALGSKGKIEHVLNFVFPNLQCNINLKEYDHKNAIMLEQDSHNI